VLFQILCVKYIPLRVLVPFGVLPAAFVSDSGASKLILAAVFAPSEFLVHSSHLILAWCVHFGFLSPLLLFELARGLVA
jgi:hypothetical protein